MVRPRYPLIPPAIRSHIMLLRTKVEEWKTKWDAEDSQTDWGSGIHSNHPSGLDKAHVFFYINLSEADWEAICPSPSVCWVQRPDAPDGILNRFFNNPDHSAHCERHSISPPYTRTIPCSLEESVGRQVGLLRRGRSAPTGQRS